MGQETMASLLPIEFAPEIQHKNETLTQRTLVEQDAVILVVNAADAPAQLARCPQSKQLHRQYARAQVKGKVSTLRINDSASDCLLVIGFINHQSNCFEQLSLAGSCGKNLKRTRRNVWRSACLGFSSADTTALLDAVLAAVLAGAAPLPLTKPATPAKRKAAAQSSLKTITLLHDAKSNSVATTVARTLATQAGNHLARWLTTLPPTNSIAIVIAKRWHNLLNNRDGKRNFSMSPRLSGLMPAPF